MSQPPNFHIRSSRQFYPISNISGRHHSSLCLPHSHHCSNASESLLMLFLLPGMPFRMPTTACKACKTQFQCHLFWDAFLMAQAVATSLLRAHSHTSMTACHTLSPPRWKTPKGSVICHLSTYQHAWYTVNAWYIVNAKKCLLNE